jgi:1,2-diacylglycerol 3-alpha-glucosyltransferase
VRILMISDVYFPRINGVSTSIQTFIKELSLLGHAVTLIAPDYTGQKGITIDIDENIIRIPSWRVPLDPEDRYMFRSKIRSLLPKLFQQKYDLVHIQTPFVAHYLGVWLARNLDLPVITTYHTFFEEYLYHYFSFIPKALKGGLARRISASQCNQTDHVFVPSTAMMEVLSGYGVKTNISVLPTGIPLNEYKQGNGERFRSKYGIHAERPVMITIGRVAVEKNIGFLIDVLKSIKERIPDILLVIAGEGPLLDKLKQKVEREKLDNQVMFVGYLDRATELQDCYHSADVFVFASRTETQGLVLLEAMAAGTPVVSTAVMGTRDVLEDGKGCLISKDDVHDFTGKVERVLRNRALSMQLSDTGRVYVRQWCAGVFAEQLVDHYQETVESYTELEAMTACKTS